MYGDFFFFVNYSLLSIMYVYFNYILLSYFTLKYLMFEK